MPAESAFTTEHTEPPPRGRCRGWQQSGSHKDREEQKDLPESHCLKGTPIGIAGEKGGRDGRLEGRTGHGS